MTNIIVVDFDDTLCIHPSEDKSDILNGEPNRNLIRKLVELKNAGIEIQIYTARGHLSTPNREEAEKKYRPIIEEWLFYYKVPYDLISFDKPYAIYYIDDKAIRPDELEFLDILIK